MKSTLLKAACFIMLILAIHLHASALVLPPDSIVEIIPDTGIITGEDTIHIPWQITSNFSHSHFNRDIAPGGDNWSMQFASSYKKRTDYASYYIVGIQGTNQYTITFWCKVAQRAKYSRNFGSMRAGVKNKNNILDQRKVFNLGTLASYAYWGKFTYTFKLSTKATDTIGIRFFGGDLNDSAASDSTVRGMVLFDKVHLTRKFIDTSIIPKQTFPESQMKMKLGSYWQFDTIPPHLGYAIHPTRVMTFGTFRVKKQNRYVEYFGAEQKDTSDMYMRFKLVKHGDEYDLEEEDCADLAIGGRARVYEQYKIVNVANNKLTLSKGGRTYTLTKFKIYKKIPGFPFEVGDTWTYRFKHLQRNSRDSVTDTVKFTYTGYGVWKGDSGLYFSYNGPKWLTGNIGGLGITGNYFLICRNNTVKILEQYYNEATQDWRATNAWPTFNFPLKVGKTWSPPQASVSVVSEDTLMLPAGQFANCYKIVNNGGAFNCYYQNTFWFKENVGFVKFSISVGDMCSDWQNGDWELISYNVK